MKMVIVLEEEIDGKSGWWRKRDRRKNLIK
jgi:hypothetical protein